MIASLQKMALYFRWDPSLVFRSCARQSRITNEIRRIKHRNSSFDVLSGDGVKLDTPNSCTVELFAFKCAKVRPAILKSATCSTEPIVQILCNHPLEPLSVRFDHVRGKARVTSMPRYQSSKFNCLTRESVPIRVTVPRAHLAQFGKPQEAFLTLYLALGFESP